MSASTPGQVAWSLIVAAIGLGANLSASSICATVIDPTRHPVRTAIVSIVNLIADSHFSAMANTNGKACVEHLPDGLYSVEAGTPGIGHMKVRYYPVSVKYPDDVILSFQLPFGEISEGLGLVDATLSGTLTAEGNPAEGVRICLFEQGSQVQTGCTVTNDLGQYALIVRPAVYRLEVSQSGRDVQTTKIDISAPGFYRNRVSISPK